MTKVLDVCEFYAPQGGGVRTYVHRKLQYAAAHGLEQVIVAPGADDSEEASHGGRIVWVKSPVLPPDPRYRVFVNERAVHAVLDRERPDVIEGSSPWSGGWFAARYPGPTPRAMIFHQDPVAVYPHTLLDRFASHRTLDRLCEPYWRYLRNLARRFDATLVSGAWLAERLRSQGIDNAREVAFGIDKHAFGPGRASAEVRSHWLAAAGAPPDAHLLVAVSRHHPEKRLGTLLRAVRRLNEARGRSRRVALVLFGDGPLRGWVQRRADKQSFVHVAGLTRDRDQLAAALASADVFLHGSAAETYGLVVAEALCSGLPLVVPDAGGAAELARPSYAELYRAGDAKACAAAIECMLARPREETGRAALRDGAARVLSADQHFENLFRFYAELAEAKRSAA